VRVDAAGDIRTRRLETDIVRWLDERISIPDGVSLTDVRNVLRSRIQKQLTESGRTLLIRWTLTGDGWFDSLLVHEPRRAELLDWLRVEFGKGAPAAWSLSLEIEPPPRIRDEWTDEDSILGDYLRIAREWIEDQEKPLQLDVGATSELPSEILESLPLRGESLRGQVLRDAALQGIGLLRGDDRTVETLAFAARDE
jgi:hypothetical protein